MEGSRPGAARVAAAALLAGLLLAEHLRGEDLPDEPHPPPVRYSCASHPPSTRPTHCTFTACLQPGRYNGFFSTKDASDRLARSTHPSTCLDPSLNRLLRFSICFRASASLSIKQGVIVSIVESRRQVARAAGRCCLFGGRLPTGRLGGLAWQS